jgi:integrase
VPVAAQTTAAREEHRSTVISVRLPWSTEAPFRKAAKLDDVRLHDLRHSFASVAASGGQSLVVIGKMLGHSQPATTARYAHLADDPVKAASDAVGKQIAVAMDGDNSSEVVHLPRTREARAKSNR